MQILPVAHYVSLSAVDGRRAPLACGVHVAVGVCMLLTCLAVSAQTVGIHEIPQQLPIDVHDGSLDDWDAVVPGPTFRLGDLTATDRTVPLLSSGDSLDLELDIYLGWTAEPPRVYAAFDMRDDYFATTWEEGDSLPFGEQYVEIGVDADRSGGQVEYDGPSAIEWSYRQAQLWRVVFVEGSEEAGGANFLLHHHQGDSDTDWLFAAPWSAVGGWIDRRGHRALVELMACPFDFVAKHDGATASTAAGMTRGDTVGVMVSVTDFDTDLAEESLDALGRTAKTWWLPDLQTMLEGDDAGGSGAWVPVLLQGPWDSATGIEQSSWGQIKLRTGSGVDAVMKVMLLQ